VFTKLKSNSGSYYIFDSITNEIFRVNPAVFTIVDDIFTLDDKAIVIKHRNYFTEDVLKRGISALRAFIRKTQPSNFSNSRIPKVIGVSFDKQKIYSFDEFLNNYSRMLTLELTQKCNLNCEYCCFGKHYSRYRSHSSGSIDVDIAERAIQYHLDKPNSGRTITFYGGEPLLEFDLLRHLVLYAEKYSKETSNICPKFSLTTNGTLLSDEIIHFLVEHQFNLLISLDGDAESHNKYRVFKNGKGSFDLVWKNMKRFVDLYPSYLGRGISVTLTADNNFFKTNLVIKELSSFYKTIIVNFVNPLVSNNDHYISNECVNKSCVRSVDLTTESIKAEFAQWTPERLVNYQKGYDAFLVSLVTSQQNVERDWPVFFYLFKEKFRNIHKRTIRPYYASKSACNCIPGAVRLYCNINGDYFPCEKMETSNSLKIGEVSSGIDVLKVQQIINYMSEVTNCSYCTGKHLCGICPTSITEILPNIMTDSIIQQDCKKLCNILPGRLQEYVSLMEKDSNVFEHMELETSSDDWLSNVFFILDQH
jgi:uncharacterized protein